MTMKLVDLAVDGTKVVANASLNRSYDAEELRGLLDRVERAIEDLEAQTEAGEDTAAAHLPEELADKEVLREKVKQAMDDLANQERHKRINLTDRDARLMKGRASWLGTTPRLWSHLQSRLGERPACWSPPWTWWTKPMTMPCWRR